MFTSQWHENQAFMFTHSSCYMSAGFSSSVMYGTTAGSSRSRIRFATYQLGLCFQLVRCILWYMRCFLYDLRGLHAEW